MKELTKGVLVTMLIQACVAIAVVILILVFFGIPVQAQDHFHYTVPMLQDTVVVITNGTMYDAQITYKWYDKAGLFVEWQSGDLYLIGNATVAKWYCLPVGDAPWFSLQLTSSVPLHIEKYMDKEIAQGYGCP